MEDVLNDVLRIAPKSIFKVDGLTYSVAKEKPRIGKDDPYWLRCVVSGKTIHKSMRTTDAKVAVDRAKSMVLAARRGRWEDVFAATEAKPATVSLSISGFIEAAKPVFAHLQDKTFQGYSSALRTVTRIVCDTDDPDAVLLESLEPDAVGKFMASFMPDGASGQELKQARRQAGQTGRSVSAQCRALFTEAALEQYDAKGLAIPSNVPEFAAALAKLRWPSARVAYERPSDAVIAATIAAIPQLEKDDLNAALAVELALGLGLRRAEIAQVRWEDFVEHDGQPYYASETLGKGGEKIRLPVLPDAWRRLKKFRKQEGFVIAGTKTEREEDVFRSVSAWMRGLGWKTEKAIHELRKYVGSKICEEYDLTTASLFLRHQDQQTTQRSYMKYLKLKDIKLDLGLGRKPKKAA